MNKVFSFLSLFGSLSTLLCCALPVTLVSIGMGATFASFSATFPQVLWLTERKDLLFITTGILLVVSFYIMKRSEKLPCPIDQEQKDACQTSKNINKKIFWPTVIIYMIGILFSYLLPVFNF